MQSMHSGLRSCVICFFIITFMLSAFVVFGFKARTEKNGIEAKEFRAGNLYISQAPVPIDQVINQLTNRAVWNDFLSKNAGYVWIDPRSGRPASLTQAIPLIPGTGENNHITLDELSSAVGYKVDKVTESVMKDVVVKFIEKYANLLNIDPKEIGEIRIANTDGNYIWDISVRRQINGIIVRSANIGITLNHGNVALWGVEKWGDVNIDLAPAITQEKAMDIAFDYIGGRLAIDSVAKTPHLEIIPVNLNWDGAVGKGYNHILAWVFTFKREGQPGNWEMIVDARQGKLVAMQDTNLYVAKKIVGMAYPLSNDGCNPRGTATSTPMAFTNTGMASPYEYANSGGFYEYTGGTAITTLSGKYVHVSDTCGAISETSTTGDIDMGGTTGQHDCTVPSGHSIGDTMSSKAAGAEIPQINRMAAGYLSYGWLNTSIGCNVNLNSTCNAYYNGSINFYRSGGGCGNTGEIAAIFDHEWSHGIDYNDPAGASNPGEVIADVIANQRLHTSCTGEGFYMTTNLGCGLWSCTGHPNVGYNCSGYGDCCTDCTGIRDADYAKHLSGNPHTPAFICTHCSGGGGPCGMEVHCENGPAAEAQWDIGARDLQAAPYNYDKQTAFEVSTRVILIGSGGVGSWYTCSCPSTSGGCAATNGYMQYITADDDDGNINNGTPHMTALYNAFNRHGIACASPTPQQSGCSGGPTAASTVTATPANNSVGLSWTTVTGAASYKVFRGEGQLGGNCDIGKQIIASVSGTSYTDAEAVNGRTYYYQVQAVGSNAACLGPMSNCVSATPVPCTSCCAFSSAVLTGNPTDGDNDAYMDNCEAASFQVTVSNIGSSTAQNCIVNITSLSNFYAITTPMPVNLGDILVGSNATTTFSVNIGQDIDKADCMQKGTFNITAQATGQTPIAGDDIWFVNEVDMYLGTVNWPFETSLDGWAVEYGTWALNTANVNPGGSTHAVHSSDSVDANCDIMISPEYEATSTTVLHVPNWYSTEPASGGYWYDRANFWIVPSATRIETVIIPASGKLYATGTYYSDAAYCGQLSTIPGWAGNSTANMTWGDSAFNLGTYNAQKFKLRMKYMTDDMTHGSGVYLDDMYMTNAKYRGCDQQTDSCSAQDLPGRVGNNLTINKLGNVLVMNWLPPGGTCPAGDYGIYRGTLPWSSYDYAQIVCSTGASTIYAFSADIGSYYFVVVQQSAGNEGSYGKDSSGNERPSSSNPCALQQIGSCN